ncbi:MAG: hypothetical protein KI786_10040 [Mameliella sp.]|nr:hypothetical protein [Phaeodactylibacter sp.]
MVRFYLLVDGEDISRAFLPAPCFFTSRKSFMEQVPSVDFNYKIGLTNRFALLIGPSYNVYLTREKVNNEFGTLDILYTISENEQSESALKQWIGINAGFSIRL